MNKDSVKKLVDEWLSLDKDPETRAEIENLWKEEKIEELGKILGKRMTFGTAGLRGPMRAGYACMNNLTIQQASQGLCMFVEKSFANAKEKGVVIGHDARHHSRTFAKIASAVFIKRGIPVYLFPSICATPHVPFTITQTGAVAGIMVTASHNPKADNGYKVYWANSAQIVSPTDKHIQDSILENLQPWEVSEKDVDGSPLIRDAGAVCWEAYNKKVAATLSKKVRFGREIPQQKILYTAMHGVGYGFVKDIFKAFGLLEPVPCDEQVQPDPNFPTAPFPNPEEKGTLNLAQAKAESLGIPIVLATDPDADRCTFAEYQKDEKKWRRFTGDEIGAIFAYRQLTDWKEGHPNADMSKVAMVNSAVSSRFIDVMGKKEGFVTAQTLTGFKWIGNKMLDLEKEGIEPLLGYEEAIGYCLGPHIIVDKDGISACGVAGELIALVYAEGKTMAQYLDEIYQKYGYTVSNNSYLYCYEPPTITKIFNRIRSMGTGTEDKYLRVVEHGGKKWEVKDLRDLHTGYDSSTADKKATLPIQPDAEMLTYTFTNGANVTLRTSGTEPKIKWYSELSGANRAEIQAELDALIAALVEVCLQPKENNLAAALG
ncbi:Phosphoglucomutase [Blattamonas nauphoetae]|uniref:Phosphoglucomutase n=1 Tax=Blattamonas nauphoetae TaxID=2049346 RepID=A0ABQ9XE85_9EUKA|nr:Phosphoglucomutase [Blattamonas nauphoetae]